MVGPPPTFRRTKGRDNLHITVRHLAALCAAGMAALLVAACSGSICDRGEAVAKSLSEKGKPCNTGDGGITFREDPNAKQRCENAVKSCSGEDIAIVNRQYDCLEKVSTCQQGSEFAFVAEIIACMKESDKISAACRNAFSSSPDGGQ